MNVKQNKTNTIMEEHRTGELIDLCREVLIKGDYTTFTKLDTYVSNKYPINVAYKERGNEVGRRKYKDHLNWAEYGRYEVFISSLYRHILKCDEGEANVEHEEGYTHIQAVHYNLFMLGNLVIKEELSWKNN